MTNEDLKKKICDIIAPYVSAYGDDERIADALIAAGIGDVKEREDKATAAELVAQAAASTVIEKIAEWKHRAEVAERALFLSAKEIEYLNGNFDSSAEFFATEKVIPYFMKRAEKELAENGKNEQD